MDAQLLIDSIARQTTVLIAQLSTAAGIRAPLAHLADEVFINLSQELEGQGLSRKVVADMFGLALRGYQKRVQRLRESLTERGKTLWQAVFEYLQAEGSVTRRRLLQRFERDDPASVAAVLSDLSSSGLVFRTGSGDSALYRPTRAEDHALLAQEQRVETAASLIWLAVYRNPDLTESELRTRAGLDAATFDACLAELREQGRVRESEGRFSTGGLLIPVGATEGWEAAVFDHFQAVCTAIATKVQTGATRSEHGDRIGGATLSFEIHDAHPCRDEVYALLSTVRRQVNELWDRVEAHNREHSVPDEQMNQVYFYFGQSVRQEEQP
jgi:hypothetical protein